MTKRIFSLILILSFFFSLSPSARAALLAPPTGSGVGQGSDYEEVFYLTGKPILLSGTLNMRPGRERGGQVADRYSFNLENLEEGVRLTRTYTLLSSRRREGRQEVREMEVSRFRETVQVGGDRYQVNDADYRFSYSTLTDVHPATTYFSGNYFGRKVYEKNRGEGKLTVNTSGETVGYTSRWGQVENRRVLCTIEGSQEGEEGEPIPWIGTVREQASFSRGQEMSYVANEPTAISFSGGYLLTKTGEDILLYDYDLPRYNEAGEVVGRNRGSDVLYSVLPPGQERLPVPAFRDIRGHWAEEEVVRMASLGVLDPTGLYFAPGLPMVRGDFARALTVVAGLEGEDRGEWVFADLSPEHPSAPYVNALVAQGVVEGGPYNRFEPAAGVTRAQAAVMAIKLLGLEGLAPVPPYRLPYLDEGQIPPWARDAIYVAGEIGILKADSYGRMRPQAVLTRGDAAVFLDNLVTYLRQDLGEEYRERLLH
ncbi:MAG: S-layer homology domain-containing protein [Firmicutes bacterium]|nr:S-layer homology domain-containing protein [Bacillota bacterium]